MSDPLRLQILDALAAVLEAIRVPDGYRNTVATVEFTAREPTDQAARSGARPWIGIVPQGEDNTDICGNSTMEWTVQLLAFVDCTKSARGVAEGCASIANDIRRAIYEDPTLNVEGVLGVRIKRRQGSEGNPQSAQEGVAAIVLELAIKFEESVTAE